MATALIAVVGTEVAKLAVKTALGSLVKLIQYERFLDKTVKNGLKRLETELKMMQASIENVLSVPQDQINLVDKFWASEVKELSREIETRLQSFMSRIESTKGTFLSVGSRQVINHQIASFIKDIMMEAKQVSNQRGRYGFSSSNTSFAKKVDPRIYALYKNESDLVGLVGATNELTKMMSNCNHVSIVGMGGLGKTTLARAVYEQMKGEFDCCAFVPVGQYANDKKVLMDILHDLRIEIYGREPDERQLINQLRDAIDGQRYAYSLFPSMLASLDFNAA
uniref:Uncharacterized protein n=1 Tax=Avena sativa TaxID=4498 RepID=A0ACD6ANE1_AVESA